MNSLLRGLLAGILWMGLGLAATEILATAIEHWQTVPSHGALRNNVASLPQ